MRYLKSICTLSLGAIILISCESKEDLAEQTPPTVEQKEEAAAQVRGQHGYGGWLCPDNFGFVPVDVQDLNTVPAIDDRLPTQEETRNGTSLMYIDPSEHPTAKPLDMDLPRVGKVYSRHNDMNELVIVIQAVVIDADTVVGYRFPSGGNGSCWYDEVTFLEQSEVADLGPMPFVYIVQELDAYSEDIWRAFCHTEYATMLGNVFSQPEFFQAEWSASSSTHLEYDNANGRANGFITNMYGNLYLHIDYESKGYQTTEKILLLENAETGKTEMHLAAGPYPVNYEIKEQAWQEWVAEISRATGSGE